jgi:hypothetical protein
MPKEKINNFNYHPLARTDTDWLENGRLKPEQANSLRRFKSFFPSVFILVVGFLFLQNSYTLLQPCDVKVLQYTDHHIVSLVFSSV